MVCRSERTRCVCLKPLKKQNSDLSYANRTPALTVRERQHPQATSTVVQNHSASVKRLHCSVANVHHDERELAYSLYSLQDEHATAQLRNIQTVTSTTAAHVRASQQKRTRLNRKGRRSLGLGLQMRETSSET